MIIFLSLCIYFVGDKMNIFVDLTSLAQNIKTIKRITDQEIIAVVKSNAYGLGAQNIIKELINNQIHWFAFNHLTEYLKNQKLLENQNVLIFESLTLEKILKYYQPNLVISINSIEDLLEIKDIKKPIRLHLQIDTGMNRLGIRSIQEYQEILALIDKNKNLIKEGIYTHFSSSVDEYKYYEYQIIEFKKYLENNDYKYIHACATSSIKKTPVGNMVRIGLALYGYGNNKLKLRKIVTGYTNVCKIIDLKKDEKVGYHQSYQTTRNEKIGVLDIGYFECPFLKEVFWKNQSYKIIAKKCMNHSYILIDDKINMLSRLSLFVKNDIINRDEYDWYQLLVSLDHLPKTYMKRGMYELPKIFKRTNEKSNSSWVGIRSSTPFNFRTIRIRRCKLFNSFK